MVKKWIIVTLLMFVSIFIFGQNLDDFNKVVDFNYTLKDLYIAATSNPAGEFPDRFIVIYGAVASRAVVISDSENYLAELDVVTGEWLGVEEAVKYYCIVQLVGPDFEKAVPARRSRNPNPAEIALNSQIIAVAKVTGLRQLESGETVPILHAYYVRKMN